ncbi:hypothetical protein CBR_g45402 [Chara braunii]|uniref:U2A'/phosphoprotein 32 family A C-terminal domain-containing protein n=1 Tax=Chara braunii TaxID=69332 RepID=A0A388LYN2_CHABU|nr:hypothetical protein CBR_g45402 [Chara braunii]|eukprot:GBG87342.1 hypothetical protein CBR_g45402 [Chara braunii]
MVRLTAAYVSSLQQDGDVEAIEKLDVSGRQISDIVDLDKCSRLTRLDISNNALASTSIASLKLCTELKWLSLAGNQLESLSGISSLSKLTVLNCSHNKLSAFGEVAGLTDLRALILNDNQIEVIARLDRLKKLDALVLSKNKIREIPKAIGKLSALSKLSLSYNRIQTLGSGLRTCILLEELRLAHNTIRALPLDLETNGNLRIVDMSSNRVQDWNDVQVLTKLSQLKQVSFRGNPVCNQDGYISKICGFLPNLEVLDGQRVRGRKRRAVKGHGEAAKDSAHCVTATAAGGGKSPPGNHIRLKKGNSDCDHEDDDGGEDDDNGGEDEEAQGDRKAGRSKERAKTRRDGLPGKVGGGAANLKEGEKREKTKEKEKEKEKKGEEREDLRSQVKKKSKLSGDQRRRGTEEELEEKPFISLVMAQNDAERWKVGGEEARGGGGGGGGAASGFGQAAGIASRSSRKDSSIAVLGSNGHNVRKTTPLAAFSAGEALDTIGLGGDSAWVDCSTTDSFVPVLRGTSEVKSQVVYNRWKKKSVSSVAT